MYHTRRGFIRLVLTLALVGAGLASTRSMALGQEAANEPPSPEDREPDSPDRLTRIEQQLQKLEDSNRHLRKRYNDLSRKYQSLLQQGNEPVFGGRAGSSDGMGVPGAVTIQPASFLPEDAREQTGEGGAGVPSDGGPRTYEPEEAGGEGEEVDGGPLQPRIPRSRLQAGTSGPGEVIEPMSPAVMAGYVDQRGSYRPDMRPLGMPASISFREGLEFRAADDFFTLEFHNLTQLDYRQFSQTGDALHDNFVIPRQRWYFQGQVSPYAYYYTVINRGYGSLDILDSWADFNFAPQYKEQFQLRTGRMKTPYTYEYIKISESDLIAPERSLFVTNFADNREEGIMAHGYLFERSLEYYAGVFDGPRRSFTGFGNSKPIFGLINYKPFLINGPEWLKNLNLTGSINGGIVRAPTQPSALTTANDQSTTSSPAIVNVSPTFLIFKSNAFENGSYMQWAGDVAYYYKSFTMLANYAGGYQTYSLQGSGTLPSANVYGAYASGAFVGVGSSKRTEVPLAGWSVACTYFLTGEEITRRVYLLEPRRPFGFYNGRLNPGAIEAYARFSNLQLGDQVFTGGFANPADWANRVSTTDTGINWYWNHYVRMYFDWQHAFYNQPVFMSDSKSTRHNDLYWFRTQIFF
ncbi:MAG TPA: porin [Gemmataceae bacterium]|nr:porin [Gemmataceae bacterium]